MSMKEIIAAFASVFSLAASTAKAETAIMWIDQNRVLKGGWEQHGVLSLPSGSIFIGDPSYGDDYHMRGQTQIAVESLNIHVLTGTNPKRTIALWLESAGTVPVTAGHRLGFGVDSAYFAFGDADSGQDIANIGNLGIPKIPDGFEFFLPHVIDGGFAYKTLGVPPNDRPVHVIGSNRDGGLEAVWLYDTAGDFSGILVDIEGLLPERKFLDTVFK